MHDIFDLSDYMRCVMRKVCAYEKTKAQMSCIVIAADMLFSFPTKIVLSVYFKIGNFKPITVFRCCTDCFVLYLGLPRRQVFS